VTDQSSRLDSLFLAALDIESAEQRAAFLESACGHDSRLREQVERLLQAHQQAGSFLERPLPEYEVTILGEVSNPDRAEALEAGLAATFPEDQAVVIGHAGHSVLNNLRRTMALPGVALRDAVDDGHDPIVRPKSGEMPDRGSDSRYQLQGEIARGGMGAILKGRDTDLGRDLAIKVLLDAHKDKPDVVQRFIEEAQIGGQLQHPGIAPVYELGQFADRRPFFSMKLVKGETLSKLLSERNDAADERGKFLAIFQQICQTMAYAHSRGVIHRDLKPANIMVGAFGEVQVMDWGLAKVLPSGGVADETVAQRQQQGQSLIQTLRGAAGSDLPLKFGTIGSQTQMGSVMGTPAYMPPEQALGEIDHLDERADVFGLGAILCEIITGKPPYVGDDGTQVFRLASRGKLNDCFARLDACGADAELVALARHCLELEPADRPRDAGALADRVTDYLESVETKLRATELERAAQAARADAEAAQANAERRRAEAESQRAESEYARAQEERKRRRISLALAASVLLLVGLGSGGWLYLLHQEADRQSAAAEAQSRHARAMQALADQRDEQRKVAEQARTAAEQARTAAELAEQTAIAQKNRADLAAEATQQNLYYAQMHLAQQAWRDHRGIEHMQNLLANWGRDDGLPPRRQWEWFYINSLPYQNLRTLPKQGLSVGRCSVAWHAPSNRLAEASADGMIRIWDVDRERITLTLQGPLQPLPYWGRTWFAWSPDGDQLAACGRDGTLHVWETVSGTERISVKPHRSQSMSVNFDSTGTQVAVCAEDGSIRFVNTRTGEIRPGVTHPDKVTAVAWSFDHQRVAMGHVDGTVTESGIQEGAEITRIPPHSRAIYSLAWSPDGRRLATACAEQFYALIWDLESRKLVSEPLRHSHAILSMAWSADGHKLATGSFDQTVKIWQTDKWQQAATLRGQSSSLYSIAWGPDDRLASGSEEGSVKVWTSLQDQESVVIPGTIRTTAATWSPDGKRLAVGSDDGLIRILDPARSEPVISLKLPVRRKPFYPQFGLFRVLAWSPDGTSLASAGTDGRVDVWNVATGENFILPPAEGGSAWCVAWSPDGNNLAAGFEDGTVQIFERVKQSPNRRVFRAHQERVFALAWSPQGHRLASGSYRDNTLRVWDPDQGKQVMAMDNRGSVLGLAWSPDGRQLATSSGLRHVRTWDAVTGQELQTMHGHHDYVNAVVWSPDGSRLASAGFDNSVRLWDPATGAEACVLRGSNGFFHDVSWNPDGARLAAACSDGNVWIWDATRGFERDTTDRALPSIDRAVAAGAARGDDLRWYAESYIRAGRIKEALDLVSEDAAALAQTVNDPRVKGRGDLIASATADTIARLKRQLVTESNVLSAAQLADLLLARDERNGWNVLRPIEMKSKGGATFTPQDDGSILVSGLNVISDVYTISAESEAPTVQAIRLDAIPDQSLPNKGPGRHSSGNFQLAKFRVFGPAADDLTQSAPVAIRRAIASFEHKAHDADAAGTIDESSSKVWHVWTRTGQPHCIYFELASPLRLNPGERLTIVLQHKGYGDGINLGRFRLSVSDDLTALHRDEQRLAATSLTDPWMKLAAAYQIVGDEPALAQLLEQHPEAAVGLADLLAAAKNWEQALVHYNRVITPETMDSDLLSRRVAVYLATEQWDLAKADWLRAVALKPDLTQTAFDQFRQAERWNEALEFGQKLLESNPNDSLHWLRLAPVVVLTGNNETYRDFCRRYALQFKNAPDVASRVIKGCLLKPDFIDLEMLPAEALTKCLDEKTGPDWLRPWAWGSRAMLAYRRGEAESAVKYAANAETLKPTPHAHLLNLAILALAEHQLGHREQSRLAFEELSRLIATIRAASRNLDHDFLIAEILLKEADATIHGRKGTPPASESP